MNVVLPPHLEQRAREYAEQAGYETVDELVRGLLEQYLDEDPLEAAEIQAALAESEEQSARGETITLEEFDRKMRAEHGLSR